MKTVFVTGSSGYIGSVLTRILLDQGFRVVGIDILDSEIKHPNLLFQSVDICDQDKISYLIRSCNPDSIIHLAGMRGAECDQFPIDAYEINFKAAVRVAEAADQQGVGKFVFASTCSNYGLMSDQNSWLDEESSLTPVSPYAISKVAAENWLTSGYLKNTKAVILRFATAFGVSPNMRYDLMINSFVRGCANQQTLEIFQPHVWRPFCHVEDIAQACAVAVDRDIHRPFDIFNVGANSENYNKQQVLELLQQQFENLKYALNNKNQDPRNYRVDFSKISKQWNYDTTFSVSDGIKQLTQYEEECIIKV